MSVEVTPSSYFLYPHSGSDVSLSWETLGSVLSVDRTKTLTTTDHTGSKIRPVERVTTRSAPEVRESKNKSIEETYERCEVPSKSTRFLPEQYSPILLSFLGSFASSAPS